MNTSTNAIKMTYTVKIKQHKFSLEGTNMGHLR